MFQSRVLIEWESDIPLLLLGLSPDLQSMEQIRRIMRPTDVPDTGKEMRPLGELSFKDGLPMENIISENESCPMVDKQNHRNIYLIVSS